MNDELDRTWKGAVAAERRYYAGISLEGLTKTTEYTISVAGVPAEIRTKHSPNTSLDCPLA
jgi:hypothetical protein